MRRTRYWLSMICMHMDKRGNSGENEIGLPLQRFLIVKQRATVDESGRQD